MARLLGLVGDTLEALGGAWLGPVILGGVVVSMAASPEMRQRIRRWGVQGLAAAMAAGNVASRRVKDAGDGTGGMVNQLGQRIVQSAAELREEWEDFLAEAQTAKNRIARSANDGQRRAKTSRREDADAGAGRTRRRVSKPRSKRPAP